MRRSNDSAQDTLSAGFDFELPTVYRAVPKFEDYFEDQISHDTDGGVIKCRFPEPEPKPNPSLPTISQEDVGICWLPLVGQVEAILESIFSFFTEKQVGFANPNPSEFVGYLFKDVSYAFFQLVVYIREEDGEPGLKIQRLDGCAFLTSNMFFELRNYLLNEDFINVENDPWRIQDEDYDFADVDLGDDFLSNEDEEEEEEEEEVDLDLKPENFTYLELEHDVAMIDRWISDILHGNYLDQTLNALMMMAHNSEVHKNVELMMSHSEGKVFEAVTKVMQEEKKSLPMIRACVRTLYNIIMTSKDLQIDWDAVKTMCDCLLTWSGDIETKFSYDRPVNNSAEIQTVLASVLGYLAKRFDGEKTEVPGYVKITVDEVNTWLRNARSVCHPEARENLEIFVQNVHTPVYAN